MLVMAIMLVFGETIDGSGWFYGMHILAVPAVSAFLLTFGIVAAAYGMFGIRLLTRAEIVTVFFCLLTAVPIMGMGFWTNFIWLSSTIPSQGDFGKIDAIGDKLWPHGPNLLEASFDSPQAENLSFHGNVSWRETEYEEGVRAVIPILHNESPDAVSALRVRVPLEKDGEAFLTLEERYLISVLARGRDMGAHATLYCRIFCDDSSSFDVEAFSEPRPLEKPTYLHRKGFVRYGVYGAEFARRVKNSVDVEFRLEGAGTLELADPKLMSVTAYESLFTGRQTVTEDEYRALRPSERTAYVVKPDSIWSWAGLKAVLRGHIPLRDWRQPVVLWLTLIALFLLATFAVALIMHRQWIANERYPLPVARIPFALLGVDEDGPSAGVLARIWNNKTMWLGFTLCLGWCLMRAWYAYNPNVPNMEIDVKLKPYLDDPSWGRMWNDVSFSISAVVLSVAIFMELNVLLSLVIGFFLFRSLYWIGEAYGWNIGSSGKYAIGAYPFGDEQLIAAYIAYGFLTLLFARKYLWHVLKVALGVRTEAVSAGGDDSGSAASAFNPGPSASTAIYRAALAMLIAAFLGAMLWARSVGVRPHAMAILFGTMVLFGFVAMKIRAECGAPFAWFTPGTRLLIPLAGGMAVFGAQGTMLSSWLSLGMILLFILPGMQMEFVEAARRVRIPMRHVFYTLAVGVLGGMLIGGWFFLSSMYGIGSNNSGFGYWFTARPWEFYPYIEAERAADAAVAKANVPEATASTGESQGINPATWGYVGGAAATAIVTVLRQIFPGFWFHPVGIILGGTASGFGMHMYWSFNIWGSLLAAWAIRLSVLKIGGAAAVRNRLFPFFIGVFLGAIGAHMILFGINAYFVFFDVTLLQRQGPVF